MLSDLFLALPLITQTFGNLFISAVSSLAICVTGIPCLVIWFTFNVTKCILTSVSLMIKVRTKQCLLPALQLKSETELVSTLASILP